MTEFGRRCAGCACVLVQRNPATARLIGLCPLLAMSNTLIKALALSLLLALAALASGCLASVFRHTVSWRLKPLYHGLIAAFATAAAIALMSVWQYRLTAALGIYAGLIAGNCLVLSFVQEIAERRPIVVTLRRGFADMLVLILFFALFGGMRELATYGTLFTDWQFHGIGYLPGRVVPAGPVNLLASPPGALLSLALVLAAVNAYTRARPAEVDARGADAGGTRAGVADNA